MTVTSPRRAGRCLGAAIALVAAVGVAQPAGRPNFPAVQRPTRERILEFLEGGVTMFARPEGRGQGERWVFAADGGVTYSSSPYCTAAGRYTVEADALRVASKGPCAKNDRLPVAVVSKDLLVFQALAAKDCVRGDGAETRRLCQLGPARLVQLVPGAKDKKLYDAVVAWAGADQSGRFYVEAPAAKTPRVDSEIFFGFGGLPEAESLARELAPVLGPMEVKEWPGYWPFPVVVVVGSRALGSAGLAWSVPNHRALVVTENGRTTTVLDEKAFAAKFGGSAARIELQEDLDGDGRIDALLVTSSGGNCCPNGLVMATVTDGGVRVSETFAVSWREPTVEGPPGQRTIVVDDPEHTVSRFRLVDGVAVRVSLERAP